MPVISSGQFVCRTPFLGTVTGDWVYADYPPNGLAYKLFDGNSGEMNLSLVSGTSEILTTADGNFDVDNAPPGFTPTTNLKLTIFGFGTLSAGDDTLLEDIDVASGPVNAVLALPDNRSWVLLRTDLFRITITMADGVGNEFAVKDPVNNQGFLLQGDYEISAYWWLLPDTTPCGDKNTVSPLDSNSHLVLAGEQPPTPDGAFGEFERLDPDDPDAAPTPVIVSVEPNHGRAGTEVTILGSGFGDDCDVQFDGVSADSITVVSQYQVRATAPAHANGFADVRVINPDGVSS